MLYPPPVLCSLLLCGALFGQAAGLPAPSVPPPDPLWDSRPDGRTFEIRQTTTVGRIPEGAKIVRLWAALPVDCEGQTVKDFRIVEAPPGWRIEREPAEGNRFLYAEFAAPESGSVKLVLDAVVHRDSRLLKADRSRPSLMTRDLAILHAEHLRDDSPLQAVTVASKALAAKICGDEPDTIKCAELLWLWVADFADHYSKDATKPTCGIGSADNCMSRSGGCCTDLHSLYIQLLRSRGIPARMEFGYRVMPSRAGAEFDPGYRCWVEWFAPGHGFTATDIVAGDSGSASNRTQWFMGLDDRRVRCSTGRNFHLEPRQTRPEPINTMIVGYAEIDGREVDVLPASDGTPSALSRTIKFVERK